MNDIICLWAFHPFFKEKHPHTSDHTATMSTTTKAFRGITYEVTLDATVSSMSIRVAELLTGEVLIRRALSLLLCILFF